MKRNVAIDQLKIFSILSVIIWHLTIYGIDYGNFSDSSVEFYILNILKTVSITCVNCFVFISGYFMCDSNVNYKKLLGLWLQVEIYSVGVYILLCSLPQINVNFEWKVLFNQMFPVLSNQYWFFTDYLLLVVIAPILNTVIENLTKEKHLKAIILLLFIFSFLPTINVFGDPFGTNKGFSLIWFSVLYLIAAYIKMYQVPKLKYGRIYLSLTLLLFGIITCCDVFSSMFSYIAIIPNLLLTYNSILVVIISLSLFLGAVSTEKKNISGSIITKMAKLSFGVYLLHEHSSLREILWEWVSLIDYVGYPILFTVRIGCSVGVIFVLGIITEYFIEQIVNKILGYTSPFLDKFMLGMSGVNDND